MRRKLAVAALVLMAMSVAGCSTTGRVDGPVLTSPSPGLFGGGGYDGDVGGILVFDGETGCLFVAVGESARPVVWPAGTRWLGDDPPRVRLPSRQVVEPGMSVVGGGGYFQSMHIEETAGTQVALAAAACAGPTGEIAMFNPGSEVTVQGD